MSNARALYPQHQIRRRARRNGSALELLVAALVVVTSTAIYSLSRSGRGGVSDQKWPHTISLCVDRHQVAAERLQPGDAFSCKKWAANFFWPGDVPLYRLPPAPVSAVHPARLEDSVCNFSSQGRRRCIKDKMHGKLEEGTAPNFDRAPDD